MLHTKYDSYKKIGSSVAWRQMSYITIYMLNSPLEVSFPAAEIFLVTPMHSNLEEIPCNMTFQSIHCLFIVTLLFISTLPFTPVKFVTQTIKKPKQTVNRPNLTYILINYMLHQLVKIKLKPPTVGFKFVV